MKTADPTPELLAADARDGGFLAEDTDPLPNAIHIVIVVYGHTYTRLLAQIGLANLAALVREIPEPLRRASVVRIATTVDDIDFLRDAPALGQLQHEIRVEVEDRMRMSGFGQHGDYGPMVLTQSEFVKEAARAGAALFFVGPDQIYSRGAFANHIARFREGYRMVIGPGVRVLRDASLPILRAAMDKSPDGSFAMDAAAQTRLLFDKWHPINDQFVLDAATGIRWKAYVYDRPAEGELLIRFFQGPTLAAWPRGPMEGFDGFIDHDLILGCCRTWREAYIIRDARECLALDLTDDLRRDIQPVSDFSRVDLLSELFNDGAVKDMQLQHGRITCRVSQVRSKPKDVGRWERRFALAVDPLISMALVGRALQRRRGSLAGVYRFVCIVGTHTWTFLLGPLVAILQKRLKSGCI